MSPDPRSGGKVAWGMENEVALLMGGRVVGPRSEQRGFPNFPETPRLVFDKALGKRPPCDLEQYHDYWLLSDRMKTVLERLDPDGFAFIKCLSRATRGSAALDYWLCDVLRILDAVDEEKSRLRIEIDERGRKSYSLMGGALLVFREEIVRSAHIFRLRYSIGYVICDQELKDRCKEAGLKGIAFWDPAKY
jgi:hypothetical protein